MNVFLWHVHGAWTTAFVQGPHRYFVPVTPGRGPDGRGRARTYPWPDTVVEVPRAAARDLAVDVVVAQRPEELFGGVERWLGGRVPGRDVPTVYLEHDAPQGRVADMRHPAADRPDLQIVHVTRFNDLFWDAGATPTCVVEHGVVDPGARYSGELARAVAVVNEPARRGRVTGTDLLARFRAAGPLDLFGIAAEQVGGVGDVPQARLHDEMARRRVYLHPFRWTSLGLSLVEAMHLAMPVVALATTETPEAVPPDAGVVSNDVGRLVDGLRRYLADRDAAVAAGRAARRHAVSRYGLARFLADWDTVLATAAAGGPRGHGRLATRVSRGSWPNAPASTRRVPTTPSPGRRNR